MGLGLGDEVELSNSTVRLLRALSTEEIVEDGKTMLEILAESTQVPFETPHSSLKDMFKHMYLESVRELIPFYNIMSNYSFSRLMQFASITKYNENGNLGERIRDSGYIHRDDPLQTTKRALFLQHFAYTETPLFSIEELEQETLVKEHHPWMWIDTIIAIDKDRAKQEIMQYMRKNPKDTSPLIDRINCYQQNNPEFAASLIKDLKEIK